VRVEVVEALTRAQFVRVTPAEQAMIARASEAEHQAAAVAVAYAREARRLLEEMGILRAPTVLDVTRADVYALGKRADALRRAMRELDASGVWQDHLSLGQVLKIAQREQVRAAVRILREGGHQVDDLVAE
jgi:hypothetical protein